MTESFASIALELTRLLAAFGTENLVDCLPGGINPKEEFALELIAAISALAAYLERETAEGRAVGAIRELADAIALVAAEARDPTRP